MMPVTGYSAHYRCPDDGVLARLPVVAISDAGDWEETFAMAPGKALVITYGGHIAAADEVNEADYYVGKFVGVFPNGVDLPHGWDRDCSSDREGGTR